MKLSKNTINVLKNMASINQGLIIKPGKVLKTMNIMKSVFVVAQVEDEFPSEFAVYDLNELLSCLALFEDPELIFHDNNLTISSNSSEEVEFYYSNPNVIVSPGDRKIILQSEEKKFFLSKQHLDRINSFSVVHKLKDLKIDNKTITVYNKNGVGNKARLDIEILSEPNSPVSLLKIENLKFIPIDYDVTISSKGIARFISKNSEYQIEYYVTLDAE